MKKSKRIDWIDSLKGLGMFFVIWGHSFTKINYSMRKYIYAFHIPLFFFTSGLVCEKDLKLNFISFIKKKVNSLIVPYFVINIIGIIINRVLIYFNIINKITFFEHIMGMLYSHDEVYRIPVGSTWFILTLFLVQVMFYLINKISRDDRDLFFLSLFSALVGYLNSISEYEIYGPWHIETVFTAILFYCLGYLFMKYKHYFSSLLESKIKSFVLGFALFIISLFFVMVNSRVSMHSNWYGSIVSFYISALSCIFGLVLFVNLFLKKSILFKKIGEYSMFYLAYHSFLIILYRHFFPIFMSGNLNFIILSIIISFVLIPFAIIVYKKFPLLVGNIKFLK